MVAWVGLILTCWLIGVAILNQVKADCFERIGDRFIIAVWLGVVILAVSLLAISIVLPLSPFVGAGVTFTMGAVALRLRSTRAEIITLLSILSTKSIFAFITLEVIVAASAAPDITFFDTGLYHFQVIRWLSRFGAVPGLALIHNRFGFTSSWFALAAPFNAGIFEARIGSLTGGFAFLLATLHFLICFSRIWQNRGLIEDWFIVIFSFLCLPSLSLYGMHISATPDLPVIVLTGIIVWINILLAKRKETDSSSLINYQTLPLILSAGAVTIKLSAFPLLLVTSFFYFYERRLLLRSIFLGCAIIFLLMLPMLGFGIIASGCPLYPSSLMCLDLPWSVGEKNAKVMSTIILNWARWLGPPPTSANSWNWLGHWIKGERATFFMIICSIFSSVAISRLSNKLQAHIKKYILLLGGCGIIFMMYRAPSLRFGLGYLCLLPALLMAAYCNIVSPLFVTAVTMILGTLIYSFWMGLSKTGLALVGTTFIVSLGAWFYSRRNNNKFFLIVPLVLICLISLKFFLINSNKQHHFFLPPKLLTPNPTELLNRETNDIKYVVSTVTVGEGQCWAAELPCTPMLIPEDIKLRDPESGIRKGFRRD
jgi:hypothetical protein